MKKTMQILLSVVLCCIMAIIGGCDGGGGSSGGTGNGGTGNGSATIKTRDFNSPEEFMVNPSVKRTISDRNFKVNWGQNYPPLAGFYETDGTVFDSDLNEMIGQPIMTNVCLFNQTTSGKIDYSESISSNGDINANAIGSYITGADGSFTIWQEGDATISGCQLHNALIISGTKLSNGDLMTETLTVNLTKKNCGGYIIPEWYESEIYFSLEGSCPGGW